MCICVGDIARKREGVLGAEYFCRVLYIYTTFNPRPTVFFITRPTGGGGGYFEVHSDLQTTGLILKLQAAFESPRKTVLGIQILMTSGSPVTSQVRSK